LDPTSRLRLATRIHFALLRQFGEAVDVGDLLAGRGEGLEALWVCAGSGDPELAAMARELGRGNRRSREVTAPAVHTAPPSPAGRTGGRVPQETPWSQNTTGFGSTRPAELPLRPVRGEPAPSWFAPMDWLRRSAAR
jgi:hypothetical protein